MIIDPAEVLLLIETFDAGDEERARASARRTARLLRDCTTPFSRASFEPGHVTASAVVLARDTESVLLVYHERLERWLQPGGHLEPTDPSVVDAARREVREETGITLTEADPPLISVDVHEIPAAQGEPAHLHHDLMFGFRQETIVRFRGEARTVWCPLSELDAYAIDSPLRRGIARALS